MAEHVYPELVCAAPLDRGRACLDRRYDHIHLPPEACGNGEGARHHRFAPPKRHRHAMPLRPVGWLDWPDDA